MRGQALTPLWKTQSFFLLSRRGGRVAKFHFTIPILSCFFLNKGPGDDCRSWCRPPGSFVIRNGKEGAGRHRPPAAARGWAGHAGLLPCLLADFGRIYIYPEPRSGGHFGTHGLPAGALPCLQVGAGCRPRRPGPFATAPGLQASFSSLSWSLVGPISG